MELDEEPAGAVNTCSPESRRQCTISFSVLLLIVSIVYVATTIVYTSYTMVIEMDNEVENHGIKVIGMHDSCSGRGFNVVDHGEGQINIAWHDPPLTYETMLKRLYVSGASWTVLPNLTISIEQPHCGDVLLLWTP